MSGCLRCSRSFTLPVSRGCCGLNTDFVNITDFNPKYQDQIRKVLSTPFESVPMQELKPAKRIRQNSKSIMNKLEQEFYDRIRDLFPNYPAVRPQAKTYKLANGVRYTPDFTASMWPRCDGSSVETAWEVKGPQAWDDAIVKIKVAATSWPEVRWVLVWKEDGQWKEQLILP